ncbi:hypothetical protein PG984_010775 [Apiospora sp. TS-2023a]
MVVPHHPRRKACLRADRLSADPSVFFQRSTVIARERPGKLLEGHRTQAGGAAEKDGDESREWVSTASDDRAF